MTEPHQTASGVITESPLVLTDVITDTGIIGHSMVFTYTPAALKPTADLIRNFEALVKGEELAPADIEQKLAKRFRLLGTQGLVGIALAAIDMALWDALARVHGLSLVRLLGGMEKPVRAYDYVGNALVTRKSQTPIQCGENWWGTLDMQHAIEARASDFVMPDVMKIGGVTGWLRAATLAQVRGLLVSNHLWPEISARLLCCTPTAHWLEYADWWNPILDEPLQVEKGMAIVGDAIGTGIEWNEDAASRFAA